MISRHVSVVAPPRHGVGSFATWVAASCEPGAHVLNIGAGKNLSGGLRPLRRRAPYLVGVDPDAAVHENESLEERYQSSLEDFAPAHEEKFDTAFAVYVLEHVEDPQAFVASCARVLKPGGSLFALTLNVRQYFGLFTWATTRLGLSERLLERLKGRDVMEAYHFPTQYRLNSVPTVTRHLADAGFGSAEFRLYDDTKRYQWYFPQPLRWFPEAYTRTVYALGSPHLMGHLTFRAVKGRPAR
jgi:SAM-dependent methyltransferase